jgi:hypothetical protein
VIERRPARETEMVLAFLKGELDAEPWKDHYSSALTYAGENRDQLIDRADLNDARQNFARRHVLGEVRGYGLNKYLFQDFPDRDTTWRLIGLVPKEVKRLTYMHHEGWCRLASTRLVGDGAKNLRQGKSADTMNKVAGIIDRLRNGERFPPLIAAQQLGFDNLILIDGHHRATAYALTDMPSEIEVLVGTSSYMNRWHWF